MHPHRFSNRSGITVLFITAAIGCAVLGRPLVTSHRSILSDTELGANAQLKTMSYNQGADVSLRGGIGWINSGPIALNELHGKVVLLDFWTYCCINCHHILPDLARLEEKYKNELVVIGVHSGKFNAERDTENIRRKVAEYRIKHPVVNDAQMTIWNRFGVTSWPTLVLIDTRGIRAGAIAGEGHYDALDQEIGQLVEDAKARGDLNLTPLHFTPEMDHSSNDPLLYPGKVLADTAGTRLFIADTGHNRIIQAKMDGTQPVTIGSGDEGLIDSDYEKAAFNRPQGMCIEGDTLYVADTENHAIRAVDLRERSVSTIAGIGSQNHMIPHPGAYGPAKTTALCSPWDVIQLQGDKSLYIAMAGPHQIWKLSRSRNGTWETISVLAGSGTENIRDGTAASACFAQPSGLATDGENLFVADSEVSGVRVITGIHGRELAVRTIVGQGLFEFGDKDGHASAVRLQHCLGLCYADKHLFIADTYNNKIKICEPRNRTVHSFVGARKAGDSDDPPHFYEPGGLSAGDDRLYVADTNNNKIRTVDLKTREVKTLSLEGLTAPRLAPRPPSFPNKQVINVADAQVMPGKSIVFDVSVPLAQGFKLNEEVPLTYLVETPEKSGVLGPDVPPEGQKIKPPTKKFTVTVPLAAAANAGEKLDLRVSLQTFICSEASNLCQIKSYIWNVPLTFTESAESEHVRLNADTK